jgi:hypothetical protein
VDTWAIAMGIGTKTRQITLWPADGLEAMKEAVDVNGHDS